MPRGRKRPPQESIDSILLAISRRDDIDPDTLSHYFDRLDEEWTEGARDKVLHLLRTNDMAAHAAAVLILSELATDIDLEELEDFVADPTVSDLAKLTLAPVLKELDSEMADDGIIEYLNDPEAAMHQMQIRLLELVGQSEMGVESILEDVITMPVDRRLGFVNWLGSSHDPRAANLLVPLLENQPSKVAMAVIDALEQLGPVAVQQAIPALNYLIAHNSNRSLKEHARTVLGRLTMQSAPGMEDTAMTKAREQHLPFHEARASFIDGSGTQMIMLSWRRPDGLLKGVNVLYQDQWGIKDCYGTDEMSELRWDELVGDMDAQNFDSFVVPFEYARALIAEARALNKRTRRKLPIAYSIWRPFIEGDESLKKNTALPSTMLEPATLSSEMLQLAQRGAELYERQEFLSWMFEPLTSVQPYIDRYWSVHGLFEVSNTGPRSRGRRGKQNEQNQKILLEELVTEALGKLLNNKWRALYEARLRRQGALFQIAGRTRDVLLIRAVAAVLHPDSPVPVQEQSFLRAMMRYSIEQGPLRIMAEALEAGSFSIPLDIFSEE